MIKYCLLFLLSVIAWKGQTQIAVSTDKMRVLYTTMHNPITVVATDIPAERMVVTMQPGTLQWEANSRYTWQYCGPKTRAVLTVSDALMPEKADTFVFRIKDLPLPDIKLQLPQSKTQREGGIAGYLTGLDLCINVCVQSFEATWVSAHSDALVHTNLGCRFDDVLNDWFFKCVPGDRFFFTDINFTWTCNTKIRNQYWFGVQLQEDGTFKRIDQTVEIDLAPWQNQH